MQLNIIALIIIVALFSGSLIGHFWFGNYYKHQKFKVFLTVITTITSIVFSTAVIIQVINFNHQSTNEEIDKYDAYSKLFIDDNQQMFVDHPEMNYFYEDLHGIKPIDEHTVRNIDLERQMSVLIFGRVAKTAMYIQTTTDKDLVIKLNTYLKRTMDTYMKSPTLRYYYTNFYKPKLAGPAGRKYIKDNYQL